MTGANLSDFGTIRYHIQRVLMSPGERIRFLRRMTVRSREEFCHRHSLNYHTLASLELDRLKPSAKQVNRIIQALHDDGLQVTASWILEARGDPPSRHPQQLPLMQGSFLMNWARFFQDHRWAVMHVVQGDHMEPFYSSHDVVGGVWSNAPHLLVGKKCIVQYHHRLYVGVLFLQRQLFAINPTNPKAPYPHVALPPQSAQVAEIVWHVKHAAFHVPESAACAEL